jgi:two-component system OmpR family response regulator
MTGGAQDLTRADGSPLRVLVVDDEVNIAELIAMALRFEGWDITMAHSGSKAVAAAKETAPDAIVLDWMLPDFDGLEVLRRVRSTNPAIPVLVLTAKDAVEDRVAGLTAGGDDYVTKPFSLEEVVLRLRAILRRTNGGADAPRDDGTFRYADLVLDEDAHEVHRGGRLIQLSPTEFNLLRYLMVNAERVVSKPQILDRVWNYDFGGDGRIVESYISYLRRKIDSREPALIHTIRGVGYSLRLPRDER